MSDIIVPLPSQIDAVLCSISGSPAKDLVYGLRDALVHDHFAHDVKQVDAVLTEINGGAVKDMIYTYRDLITARAKALA